MEKITLNTLFDINFLSGLSSNREKGKLVFVKSESRLDENDYIHTLYSLENGAPKRLLDLGNDSRYFWESESSILLPLAKTKHEKERMSQHYSIFYRYDLITGELQHAYTFPVPIGSITVLKPELLLLTVSLSEADHILLSEDNDKRSAYVNQIKEESFFETFEEIPFYSNGAGFTKGKRDQLFLFDTSSNTYTALSGPNQDAALYHLDRENSTLYISKLDATGVPSFYNNVFAYNYSTQSETPIYTTEDYFISKVVALNGNVYALASTMKEHGINQNGDFYQIVGNAMIKVLDFGFSAWNSVGSDCRYGGSQTTYVEDNMLFFNGTYQDHSVLYSFDGQSLKTVFNAPGSLDGWARLHDTVYAIGLFNNNLQELYSIDLSDSTTQQISKFNGHVLKDKYVAKPEHVRFVSDDTILDGWVLLPENYDTSQEYPAILDIHGGPKTVYGPVFYHEMQYWTNLGYIVFFMNPRGSDAYGNDFMNIFGKYGDIDYKDIMRFTDFVLDKYSIDPNRVGVTGGSYGGFMTNWIVGHTDRFACAATQRSISNWISFYGTSDIGFYFGPDQTKADPFNDTEKMWNQSPLKYARNVKTPLLFIHSEEDYRCPIEQGMQFFTAIKHNGVETRFVWIRNENHDLSRTGKPKSRKKRLEEITSWMNRYLLESHSK